MRATFFTMYKYKAISVTSSLSSSHLSGNGSKTNTA